MNPKTTGISRGSQVIGRRTALVGIGGFLAAGLEACGGGGGGGEPATPAAGAMTLQSYPARANRARGVLTNAAGDTVTMWSDPSTNVLQQALVQARGRQVRTYYSGGAIERVVDEDTGRFVTMTAIDADRTELNLYDRDGAWQGGYAILRNADGSYSAAPIVSSAALPGSELSGELTGALEASFSLTPDSANGLGTVKAVGGSSATFALAARIPVRLAVLDRLSEMFLGTAHAQVPPWFTPANALLATVAVAGGLVVASAAGSTTALLVGFGLLGVAAYGLFANENNLVQTVFSDISRKIMGALGADFSEDEDTSAGLEGNMRSYLAAPGNALASLPTLDDLASRVTNTVSTTVSTVVRRSHDALQAITSGPPAGLTALSGFMVDTTGAIQRLTGTFDPATHATTFDSGTSTGTRVQGSTSGSGSGGTYTVTSGSTTDTGTFTVAQQTLGACQVQQNSGGQGTFTKTYDLGQDAGTFELSYDMFSIPDQMSVVGADGTQLFSTGGLVSGSNTVQVAYSSGRRIVVILSAPNSGTAWNYTIGCPS